MKSSFWGVSMSPCVQRRGLEGLQSVSHHKKHLPKFCKHFIIMYKRANIPTKIGVTRIGEWVKLAELVMVMVPGLFWSGSARKKGREIV